MLRITIDLIPHGDSSRTETIGCIYIANDGSGDLNTGYYNSVLTLRRAAKRAVTALGAKDIWKRARVEGFPRKRLGPYDLLYRILHAAVGSRNKGLN